MDNALTTVGVLDPGDASTMLPALQAAVRERPEDFEAVYSLGLCLYRARSCFLAEHAFRHAVSLRYDDLQARDYLALSLESQQKTEQAAAEYRTAARLSQDVERARVDVEVDEAA